MCNNQWLIYNYATNRSIYIYFIYINDPAALSHMPGENDVDRVLAGYAKLIADGAGAL